MDYLKLYDLEGYLFDDVRTSFEKSGKLSAFDFFCIIIWKANRAKSKIAHKLVKRDGKDLDTSVHRLTSAISQAPDDMTRMRLLIEEWKFRLPMASAILTVLYPDSFTVYDVRVCEELQKDHKSVQNKTRFNDLWDGYQQYVSDTKIEEPEISSLRDKDRALWARSFEKQLKSDLHRQFGKI